MIKLEVVWWKKVPWVLLLKFCVLQKALEMINFEHATHQVQTKLVSLRQWDVVSALDYRSLLAPWGHTIWPVSEKGPWWKSGCWFKLKIHVFGLGQSLANLWEHRQSQGECIISRAELQKCNPLQFLKIPFLKQNVGSLKGHFNQKRSKNTFFWKFVSWYVTIRKNEEEHAVYFLWRVVHISLLSCSLTCCTVDRELWLAYIVRSPLANYPCKF